MMPTDQQRPSSGYNKDGTRKSLVRDFDDAAEEDATQADSPVRHYIPLNGSLPKEVDDGEEDLELPNFKIKVATCHDR